MDSKEMERLAQIGLVMDSVGINTVELAEKLKDHVAGCPGGQRCIADLLSGEE
jgi:hypothetical protein